MLTASVPTAGSGSSHDDAEQETESVASLLTAPIGAGEELPCSADPDLWFAENPQELELAKARCADCPIRSACLAGALSRGEPWGVWGGEILERGAVIARKRPRGRPRKNAAPVEPAAARRQERAA
ncbi:WhiB family transcriptional regulator [Saccharopolyspora cebuensis]|uniref:Transcriptional regulator WhiB n=1 Tax=Saccharopolyspora cebuensis TaxID=418759 RepID=A0ABV4CRI6_9PSEU